MRVSVTTIIVLLLALAGLAQEPEKLQPVEGLTIAKIKYLLAATQRDEDLERAIIKAFEIEPKEEVRYLFNRVSLSKGGQQALVLLPGAKFSGSGGSSAAVFERTGGSDYRLVTRFTLMRTPIVVAPSTSKGWHDLVVRASGGGMPAQYSRLRFDGSGYPKNPTSVEGLPAGTSLSGTAYLATPLGPDAGLLFVAP